MGRVISLGVRPEHASWPRSMLDARPLTPPAQGLRAIRAAHEGFSA